MTKVGDRVKIVQEDSKGWQRVIQGVVTFIDDERSPPSHLILVKPTYLRCQHRDHPERGRDLPVRQEEEAFSPSEIQKIED